LVLDNLTIQAPEVIPVIDLDGYELIDNATSVEINVPTLVESEFVFEVLDAFEGRTNVVHLYGDPANGGGVTAKGTYIGMILKLSDEVIFNGENADFIEGEDVLDPVAQTVSHQCSIFREPIGTLTVAPTAFFHKAQGQVPMIEGQVGFNAVFKQFIHQVTIKLNALFVDLARAIGQDTGPRDGEAIGFETHLLHNADIFFIKMVVVAGNIRAVAIFDFTAIVVECVPNGRAFSVYIPRAFNLESGRSGAPSKVFLKHRSFLPLASLYLMKMARSMKKRKKGGDFLPSFDHQIIYLQ
jgi:hypothetical protein